MQLSEEEGWAGISSSLKWMVKYNEIMKKMITPVTVLLMVLIVLVGGIGFGLYRMQQAVQSLARDFSQPAASGETTITTNQQLFDVYAGIYANLEEYGVASQYGEETADLANLMFEKTLKNCSVTSVEYQKDGFLVTVEGDGIPLSAFDQSMWGNAVARAAGSFLSNHFFDAAAALFQGEDAIKSMLFKDFGEDIFQAADQEISRREEQHVAYTFSIHHEEDGWQIQMINEEVSPLSAVVQ